MCATLLSTTATGMENIPQGITDRFVMDHVFEVNHPTNGKPCYLMGTQHVNGDVTDNIVTFVINNISKVYFEKCYEHKFRLIAAPFFAQLYINIMDNIENSVTFVLSENTHEFFKESIEKIESEFNEIKDLKSVHKYTKNAYEFVLEDQKEQNEMRKVKNSANDAGALMACVGADKRCSELAAFKNEGYNNLNEHDKNLIDSLIFVREPTSETNPKEMEKYIAITMDAKAMSDVVDELRSGMNDEEKGSADAWLSQFDNETEEEREKRNADWETQRQQETALFSKTILPSINPVDVITLALFNKSQGFLDGCYENAAGEREGVEESLQTKLAQNNSDMPFLELETDYTRLLGMRNRVAHHMYQMDQADPYGPWIEAIPLLDREDLEHDGNAIFEKPGTKGNVLPQFLIDVLNGTLITERENHWLETIHSSMANETSDKHSLFAVGNSHIFSLLGLLSSEGYMVNKMDLA